MLTSDYHAVVVFDLHCAVPADGVRCCRIALLGHNLLSYWSTRLFFFAKTSRSFVP